MAMSNEADLTATLDSMWVDIHGDSLSEIAKAFAKLGAKTEPKVEDTANKDSEAEETKDSEAEETKDSEPKEGEEKTDDSEAKEEKEEKDGCNKDSATVFATKDDIKAVLDSQLKPLVMEAVKECLNIKDNTTTSVEGGELDSATKVNEVSNRDYSSFLD